MPEGRESGMEISVRVQIIAHSAHPSKKVKPLKAFRMRMRNDSTFGDLAGTALARYVRENPQQASGAGIDSLLDDKFFAADLEDTLDLLSNGEIMRLMLAPSPRDPIVDISTSENSDDELGRREATSSQTPAVKGLRFGRGPAIPSSLPPARQPSSRVTRTSSSVPRPRLPQTRRAATRPGEVAPRSPSNGKAVNTRKRDPYEIPSDSEQMLGRDNKKRTLQHKSPTWPLGGSKANPGCSSPTPLNVEVISIADSAASSYGSSSQGHAANQVQQQKLATRPHESPKAKPGRASSIPPEAKVISIIDSAASLDESTDQDFVVVSSSQGSVKSRGKRPTPHTVNKHLEVVEGVGSRVQGYGPASKLKPAYMVKTSQGIVPVFRKTETPAGSETRFKRQRTLSTSSSKHTGDSKGVGSLTIAPSQIRERVKDLQAQMDRESKEREAELKQAAEREAYIEREEEKKAKANGDFSKTAIARMKGRVQFGSRRTRHKLEVPKSFFEEPESSDDDLAETLGVAAQSSPVGQIHEALESDAFHPSSSNTRGTTPVSSWKPINTLFNTRNSGPRSSPPRKFGPGYSLRVREAFSDAEDERTAISGSEAVEDSPGTNLDVPGTPGPFERWMSSYETMFATHFGFCSVADGPWKGLIRTGPEKGQYLPGFCAPTQEQIMELERTAVRRERQWNDFGDMDLKSHDGTRDVEDGNDTEVPLTPTARLDNNSTSASSDASSVRITKQPLQDTPPSNQELAFLMSSSPSRHRSRASPSRRGDANKPAHCTTDDSEPRPGGGDYLNDWRRLDQDMQTPQREPRRSDKDADLEVTPNFERALSQVETPSTRSRSTARFHARHDKPTQVRCPGVHDFVVKIPELPVMRRAGYKIVPENNPETGAVGLIRSFEEINDGIQDSSDNSQDSGVAVVEHVLKASPSWLSNVTELVPAQDEAPASRGTRKPINQPTMFSSTPIPVPIIPCLTQSVTADTTSTTSVTLPSTQPRAFTQGGSTNTLKTASPHTLTVALPQVIPTTSMPLSPVTTLAEQFTSRPKVKPEVVEAGAPSNPALSTVHKSNLKKHGIYRTNDLNDKRKRKKRKEGIRKDCHAHGGAVGKLPDQTLFAVGPAEASLVPQDEPAHKMHSVTQPNESKDTTNTLRVPDAEPKDQLQNKTKARARARAKKREKKRENRFLRRKRERPTADREQLATITTPMATKNARKARKDRFEHALQRFPSPPPTSRPSSAGSIM